MERGPARRRRGPRGTRAARAGRQAIDTRHVTGAPAISRDIVGTPRDVRGPRRKVRGRGSISKRLLGGRLACGCLARGRRRARCVCHGYGAVLLFVAPRRVANGALSRCLRAQRCLELRLAASGCLCLISNRRLLSCRFLSHISITIALAKQPNSAIAEMPDEHDMHYDKQPSVIPSMPPYQP